MEKLKEFKLIGILAGVTILLVLAVVFLYNRNENSNTQTSKFTTEIDKSLGDVDSSVDLLNDENTEIPEFSVSDFE
jgi:hypothetical protein